MIISFFTFSIPIFSKTENECVPSLDPRSLSFLYLFVVFNIVLHSNFYYKKKTSAFPFCNLICE